VSRGEEAAGPLEDVRVLEFAQVMAVPTCGLLLADMGAEVIKVEPPHGDSFRLHLRTGVPGEGKGYAIFNRGKRSLCLDLTHAASSEVVERLVQSADVVLVSFKPSDLPRYGLDYERLRRIQPRLVYLENTPYGPDGPFGQDGGYDVVVQGMSGTGAITAAPVNGAPRFVRPAYADMGTGFLAALAVVAALRHRDRTGEGQRVRTSLLSTALTLGANLLHRFEELDSEMWERLTGGLAELREGGADFAEQQAHYYRTAAVDTQGNIYFRHYRTRDGFLSVGCLSPALNERFRKATGLEDPRRRSDFDSGSPEGQGEVRLMVQEAEALFRSRSTDEWVALMRAAGVPCGPFHFPPDVFDDPQVRANEYLVALEHDALGRYETFAPPIRMEASPVRPRGPSPALDRDTDAVLSELGFEGDAIEALRAVGAVGRRRA
jgi:crotonobetainyl-CoA:carnitine CoA-transferase CaiB-like acyl-CoA transferase